MTDKEQQIEEMANIITKVAFIQVHEIDDKYYELSILQPNWCGDNKPADIVAEALYNAGYRKVDKKDGIAKQKKDKEFLVKNNAEVRKETAEEILFDLMEEFADRYGVEIDDLL